MILEGESLLNDASALLVYRLAVGAAVGGVTVWTAPLAALSAVGGVALGVALAQVIVRTLAIGCATSPASMLLQLPRHLRGLAAGRRSSGSRRS